MTLCSVLDYYCEPVHSSVKQKNFFLSLMLCKYALNELSFRKLAQKAYRNDIQRKD